MCWQIWRRVNIQHPPDPIYTPGLGGHLYGLVDTRGAWGKATSSKASILLALGTDLPTPPLHSHPTLRLPTALLLLSHSLLFPLSPFSAPLPSNTNFHKAAWPSPSLCHSLPSFSTLKLKLKPHFWSGVEQKVTPYV